MSPHPLRDPIAALEKFQNRLHEVRALEPHNRLASELLAVTSDLIAVAKVQAQPVGPYDKRLDRSCLPEGMAPLGVSTDSPFRPAPGCETMLGKAPNGMRQRCRSCQSVLYAHEGVGWVCARPSCMHHHHLQNCAATLPGNAPCDCPPIRAAAGEYEPAVPSSATAQAMVDLQIEDEARGKEPLTDVDLLQLDMAAKGAVSGIAQWPALRLAIQRVLTERRNRIARPVKKISALRRERYALKAELLTARQAHAAFCASFGKILRAGKWLSAAIGDPEVCKECQNDFNEALDGIGEIEKSLEGWPATEKAAAGLTHSEHALVGRMYETSKTHCRAVFEGSEIRQLCGFIDRLSGSIVPTSDMTGLPAEEHTKRWATLQTAAPVWTQGQLRALVGEVVRLTAPQMTFSPDFADRVIALVKNA